MACHLRQRATIAILSILLLNVSINTKAFTPPSLFFKRLHHNNSPNDHHNNNIKNTPAHTKETSLSSSTADNESTPNKRRQLLAIGATSVITGGLIANKIAIEGPTPYQPPPSSLSGKLVLITGGNTGLGLESAKRLALAGATIVVTSRSETKGARAVNAIKAYATSPNDDETTPPSSPAVYVLPLDLCDLKSVASFPRRFRDSPVGNRKIDVLMNNAGVMAVPDFRTTVDGYETTFQSNHLGHFALTASLMPYLAAKSRVVNVASAAYLISGGGLDMDNLNAEKGYKRWDAYGRSKLANILFTKELQRRAAAAGLDLTAVSLHPGAVRTDLPRYIVGEDKFVSTQDPAGAEKVSLATRLALIPGLYFTKAVDRGATTQIWLAAGEGGEDVGGKFYQNCKEVKLSKGAMDMVTAGKLWTVSEQLSGVSFDI